METSSLYRCFIIVFIYYIALHKKQLIASLYFLLIWLCFRHCLYVIFALDFVVVVVVVVWVFFVFFWNLKIAELHLGLNFSRGSTIEIMHIFFSSVLFLKIAVCFFACVCVFALLLCFYYILDLWHVINSFLPHGLATSSN